MLQTTTLKRNLVPRFGKARKKDRFRQLGLHKLGGLPPLKESFLGSLRNLFFRLLGLLSLNPSQQTMHTTFQGYMCSDSLPIGCVYPHRLECGFSQDGFEQNFPHGRVVHKHKFVELPLILRGHSLGQSKDFGFTLSTWSFDFLVDFPPCCCLP